ncbi:MAG: PQQ-binding-like beta-propeller repeat protein [Euryarchaeota archaeon]|nr:PQQ-binding-like beta-propeller repeat protein [Euryarchaeota archaeon]
MFASRPALLMVVSIALLMALPNVGAAPPATWGTPAPVHAAAASGTVRPNYGQDTWTEFQHDSANSGLSGDTPVASNVDWNTTLPNFPDGGDYPMVSSPVVGQGLVFFAAGDDILALNATTGARVWNTTLDRGVPGVAVDGTPALWRGMLFLSQDLGGFPPCTGGAAAGCSSLYALNATNGTIMQSIPQTAGQWGGGAAPNSPVPLSGPDFGGNAGLLFTDFYGFVYSYTWSGTALTFLGSNAAARAGGTRTTSSPSIALLPGIGGGGSPVWGAFYLDGNGGGGGHNVVRGYQLNGATAYPNVPGYPAPNGLGGGQALAWTGTDTGSISVANMTAGGTSLWPYGFFGDDAGPGAASHLVAMNLTAHSYPGVALLQTTNPATDCGLVSTPTIVSDWRHGVGLVVTDLNGTVSRWNFTVSSGGAQLSQQWNRTLGGTPVGSAAIAGDVAYVADSAGDLYALSVNTGNVEWSTTLSAAVRSNFALAYSRLFAASDPVGGGTTGNLTAFGPAPGPGVNRLSLATTIATNPVASGQPTALVAQVQWHKPGGALGGPAAGALVNFSAALGTFFPATTTADSAGYAYSNWTAPAVSPVPYTVALNSTAWAPMNVSAASSSTVTVLPGGSGGGGGGGGPKALSMTVSPLTHTVNWTAPTVELIFTVHRPTSGGGVPANGASVFMQVASGPGSVSPTTGTANGAGEVFTNFTGSTSLSQSATSLVVGTATLNGYNSTTASSAIETLAAPPPGSRGWVLSLVATPTSVAIWPGNVTGFVVTLTNGTSGSVEAGWVVTASPPALGTFASNTETTNGMGLAWFNFTAGSTTGASLETFSATVRGVSGATSVAISVFRPSSSSTSIAPQNKGLSTLDWGLIALVIALAIALILALAFGRRRSKGLPTTAESGGAGGAALMQSGAKEEPRAESSSGPASARPETEEPPAEAPASVLPTDEKPASEDTSPISIEEPSEAPAGDPPSSGSSSSAASDDGGRAGPPSADEPSKASPGPSSDEVASGGDDASDA